MSSSESQKSARSIRQLLDQKPNYGRDDPRFWREKIDRWEKGKDRKRRQMDTRQRGKEQFSRKPQDFWQKPQEFWQGPQEFWQEPEPLKDALIAEIVKPLEAKLRRAVKQKLEELWAVKKVRRQQAKVGRIKWFFQNLQNQFEGGFIKFLDYLRILKAFYAFLKLLDERRQVYKEKKEREQLEWEELQESRKQTQQLDQTQKMNLSPKSTRKLTRRLTRPLGPAQPLAASVEESILEDSFREERAWIVREIVSVVQKEAKDDAGLADQFLQEMGKGSLEEIELIPGLTLKVKDTSGGGGDDGGGSGADSAEDSSSADDSSSESESTKKKDKPKTPKEQKASLKWAALSSKLRAEVTGLNEKEAKKILKEFGKAVANGDENEARKTLSKAKNSTEIWKWAKGMFFKK